MRTFTERETLEIYIYESHKDAFGTKGRHYDFASMSLEELKKEADWISKRVAERIAEDQILAERAIEAFKSQVTRVREAGAPDYDTALRWLYEAAPYYKDATAWHEQEIEQWVWSQGFLFTDYGKQVVERLMSINPN